MQIGVSDQLVRWVRAGCVAILLASAVGYIVFTIRWPWMWDDQVFHYDVFLMKHGWVPYRDIYDINMPGCYLLERWAIAVFGGGDLGWRIYEFLLLGVLTVSGMVIARPYDWLAGLFSGVIFAVLHGADGAAMAVERDEIVTVLLMLSFALLCIAVRRGRSAVMVGCGFVCGMAMLVKPTAAPFGLLYIVLLFAGTRAHARTTGRYLVFGALGLTATLAILAVFMLPDSLGPFLELQRRLIPYYASLGHASWMYLLRESLPPACAILIVVAAAFAVWGRREAGWELWGVRACVLLGALSYFAQRKGYTYHRYSFVAFALLWAGVEFGLAMKSAGARKLAGSAAMAAAVLLILPHGVNILRHSRHDANPLADQLQADLVQLGGSALQNRVQCLDLVTGCYSALYRLGLVQSTGWMGDLQFFSPDDHNAVPYYRQMFWYQIQRNPPKVIVLSSEWFGAKQYSFDKLDAWPQLRDYLNSAYMLEVTRSFGSFDGNVLAYRIYVLQQQ
ncbi:MAG TPA: glycosyltransferase family 39 protein [Acidobacteriaceae bacterium]|jgi:hypothetical protein|nr:glycosyltransferase family 39 protein [Acidobacteriaceae bacterium]